MPDSARRRFHPVMQTLNSGSRPQAALLLGTVPPPVESPWHLPSTHRTARSGQRESLASQWQISRCVEHHQTAHPHSVNLGYRRSHGSQTESHHSRVPRIRDSRTGDLCDSRHFRESRSPGISAQAAKSGPQGSATRSVSDCHRPESGYRRH